MTDIRTKIADLIPLSLLDGRDERKDVFEVADQIIALLTREGFPFPSETIRVRYNRGGSATWTAVEEVLGWWRIKEWPNDTLVKADQFWSEFTEVEEDS